MEERRYIITSRTYVEGDIEGISEESKLSSVIADEGKAKEFVETMLGCLFDGGKMEIEVKVF